MKGCPYSKFNFTIMEEKCEVTNKLTNNAILCDFDFEDCPHDIRTITNGRLRECGIDPAELTVISAGFPCQPYSLAGKGLGDSDSRDLWGEVTRVLGELQPRWFVGENTPGLFARENQRYFRRILSDLAALGYSVGWGIWGAVDVGAPHKRDRVFIVAHRSVSHSNGWGRIAFGAAEQCVSETLDKSQQPNKLSRADSLSSTLSDTASDELGVFGSEKETAKTANCGKDNSDRVQANVSGEWWQTEPDVGRVANGVPARVDRLRCLGNAVVPAQAYPIFEAIVQVEWLSQHGKEV